MLAGPAWPRGLTYAQGREMMNISERKWGRIFLLWVWSGLAEKRTAFITLTLHAFTCLRFPVYESLVVAIQNEQRKFYLQSQDGKCPLCRCQLRKNVRLGMHMDHDHVTLRIRKLLCGLCNRYVVGHIEKFSIRLYKVGPFTKSHTSIVCKLGITT